MILELIQNPPYNRMKIFLFLGILLAVLNALDGTLTYIGLVSNQIEEGNPLMAGFAPIHLLLIKLLFSAALTYFLFNPQYIPHKRFIFPVLIGANILYIAVMFLHIFWITVAL